MQVSVEQTGALERRMEVSIPKDRIEKAVMRVCSQDLESMSAGKMGKSTSEVGDLVVKYIRER